MIDTTFTVVGMTCGHCVRSVTTELNRLDGVTDVDVDLASGLVLVGSAAPLDALALRGAVERAGYALAD